MTSGRKLRSDKISHLEEALIEDIINAPDEEILADDAEIYGDDLHLHERRLKSILDRALMLPDRVPLKLAASTSAAEEAALETKGPVWVESILCEILADPNTLKFYLSGDIGDAAQIELFGDVYSLTRRASENMWEIVGLMPGDIAAILQTHGVPQQCARLVRN